MGQYHLVVNLDKREYIHPHTLGNGLKLMEQACSFPGTPNALFLLLAASNGRGGGDAATDHAEVLGRWAGDRIAVVGDYAEDYDFPVKEDEPPATVIYSLCGSPEHLESARAWQQKLIANGSSYARPDLLHWYAPEYRFNDITAAIQVVMEEEFGIRYQGSGWRTIERDPEASFSVLD